jgi:prepilin-type N-terminal cleavage/methylation domain-containing protein
MLQSNMKGTRQAGFTILELMFTVAIAAVLLAIGVPNFRDFIRNSRMSAQANDLLSGVNLARSEAVKRRTSVTLCAGTPADCDATGNFRDGWVVFADENGNGEIDGGDAVLLEHAAMPDGFVTRVMQTSDAEDEDFEDLDYSSSATRYVSFGQNGFRRMNDGTLPVALALVMCDERDNALSGGGPDLSAARALELSTTGRASITRSKERITALGDCP